VTNPNRARLMAGLLHTFAFPWADRHLAPVVLALAVIGAGAMALRSRAALALLLVAVVPYGLFHRLFQESIMTRYALPIVPAVAYFAVRCLDALAPRVMGPSATMLSLAGLAVAMPPVVMYARTGSPAYQAVAQIEDRLARIEFLSLPHAACETLSLTTRAVHLAESAQYRPTKSPSPFT
jgi:hypothetical protein